jgi:hypothetical protein
MNNEMIGQALLLVPKMSAYPVHEAGVYYSKSRESILLMSFELVEVSLNTFF